MQGRGERKTLLRLWVCYCLTKRQLNVLTRPFNNLLVRLTKYTYRNLIPNRARGLTSFTECPAKKYIQL